MNYNKINYDECANAYSKYRNASDRIINHILDTLKDKDINKVLEIGCGTADHLFALKEKLGFVGYGFDKSVEMLKEAVYKNPDLLLAEGNANYSFPYEDNIFEFAYSVNVIHYINNLKQYYYEANRVLKDNGIVLTITANTDKMKENISKYFPKFESGNNSYKGLVSTLTEAMKSAGFKDVFITHTDYEYRMTTEDLEPIKSKAYAWVRLLSEECFLSGMKLLLKDIEENNAVGSENFTYIWGYKKD